MSLPPVPWLDIKRQYLSIKDEVDAAVHRVMDSGYYIGGLTSAPEALAFEQEWAAYCGTRHGVAVGSGTAALNLTLRALGVGPGDEVITVSFTLSATMDAIVALGARPVIIDVDPATYTMDVGALEAAITPRTKAILPVHIYGQPADLDAINAVAAPRGIPVVADACEAHGATYKGRPVTEFATASCFSFYPTKTLGSMGDAGGVVTDDDALAEKLRQLRVHGWDGRFHSAVSSLNSRMDEIQAAVLRTKLPYLDRWNARRIEIARRYDAALEGTSIAAAPRTEWAESSYYVYVVRTKRRDAFRQSLKDAGIGSDVHWPEPPHLQPAFASLGHTRGAFPVTERLCDEVVTMPMFAELTDAEVDRVCEAMRGFGSL